MGGCGGKPNQKPYVVDPKLNGRPNSGEYLDEPYDPDKESEDRTQQSFNRDPRKFKRQTANGNPYRNAPNNVRDDDNNSLFADEKKVPGRNQQISANARNRMQPNDRSPLQSQQSMRESNSSSRQKNSPNNGSDRDAESNREPPSQRSMRNTARTQNSQQQSRVESNRPQTGENTSQLQNSMNRSQFSKGSRFYARGKRRNNQAGPNDSRTVSRQSLRSATDRGSQTNQTMRSGLSRVSRASHLRLTHGTLNGGAGSVDGGSIPGSVNSYDTTFSKRKTNRDPTIVPYYALIPNFFANPKLRIPLANEKPGLAYNSETPYLNALVQCFWGTQPLVDYFLYDIYVNEETMYKYMTEEERLLTELFAEATKLYWLEPSNPLDISELSVFVSEVMPLPEVLTADCIVDLLDLFLDELHGTLNRQFKFRSIYDEQNSERRRRKKKQGEPKKEGPQQDQDQDKDQKDGFFRVRGSHVNPLASFVIEGRHDPEVEYINALDAAKIGKAGLNRLPSIRANAPGLINSKRLSFRRPMSQQSQYTTSQQSEYTNQTRQDTVHEEENEDEETNTEIGEASSKYERSNDNNESRGTRSVTRDEERSNYSGDRQSMNASQQLSSTSRRRLNGISAKDKRSGAIKGSPNASGDEISQRSSIDQKHRAPENLDYKDHKRRNPQGLGSNAPSQSYYSDAGSLRSMGHPNPQKSKPSQQSNQKSIERSQTQNSRSENGNNTSPREHMLEESKGGKKPVQGKNQANEKPNSQLPSKQPTEGENYSRDEQSVNMSQQSKELVQKSRNSNESLNRNNGGKTNNPMEYQQNKMQKPGNQNGTANLESNDFDDEGVDSGGESYVSEQPTKFKNQKITKGSAQAPEKQNNSRNPAGAGKYANKATKNANPNNPKDKKMGDSHDEFFEDNGIFTGQHEDEEEEEEKEERPQSVINELQNRQLNMQSGPENYAKGKENLMNLRSQHSSYLVTMQDEYDPVTKRIHVERNPATIHLPFELRNDTEFYRQSVKEAMENARHYWKEYLRGNSSIIVDLLVGQLMTSNVCAVCSKGRTRFEAFMYISFYIPEPKEEGAQISIYDCLAAFTTQELDTETKNWFCPECDDYRDVYIHTSLWVLPGIFIVQLEREDANDPNYWNNSFVDVPLDDFDLQKYSNTQQRDIPLYRLYAVLEAIRDGDEILYVAKVKNRVDQQWYIYEEDQTTLIENPEAEVITEHAYLLFFQNKSAPYFSRQQVNRPQLWPYLDYKLDMNIFKKGIYKDLVDPSYVKYLKERNLKALNLDAVEERIETIVETDEEDNDNDYDHGWRDGLKKDNDDGYWPKNPHEMLRKSFDPQYRVLQSPDINNDGKNKGALDPDIHSWVHETEVQPILGINKDLAEKPVSRQLPDKTLKSIIPDEKKPESEPKANNSTPNGLHNIILNSDKSSHFVNKLVNQANPVQDLTPKPVVKLKTDPLVINDPDKFNEIKELLHIGQYVNDYHKKGGPVPDIHPEYQPRVDPVINKPRTDLEYRRINENNFLHKEPGEVVTRDQKKRPEDDSTSGDAKISRLKGLH